MSNNSDRYVTWGMFVPEGVSIPTVDPWSLPVWFPDPGWFFPKDVAPMYAIRNGVGSMVLDLQGNPVQCVAPGWYTYSYGTYQYVPEPYFVGGIPDTSGGAQYPPEGMRQYDVTPPDWVINGTLPPGQEPAPGPDPVPVDPVETPDPGGGGMAPPTDPDPAPTPTPDIAPADTPTEAPA
jgi:hypothetical protein